MDPTKNRKLIGKIELSGILECITGLHIGASKDNMEIGALDSPVVRDPLSNEPYIPGSSLKGKLRALLEKAHPDLYPNRDGGSNTSRHECNDWDAGKSKKKNFEEIDIAYPGALHCPVCRLFGSTGPGEKNRNFPARLKVRDLCLDNAADLENLASGLLYTEWKFENSIDRITSAANPRNLERVPRGAKFRLSMVYDVEDVETITADLENLKLAVNLLHDDALGGHGSRGYGQVEIEFKHIQARRLGHYRGERGQTKEVTNLENINELAEFFQAH